MARYRGYKIKTGQCPFWLLFAINALFQPLIVANSDKGWKLKFLTRKSVLKLHFYHHWIQTVVSVLLTLIITKTNPNFSALKQSSGFGISLSKIHLSKAVCMFLSFSATYPFVGDEIIFVFRFALPASVRSRGTSRISISAKIRTFSLIV